MAPDKARSRLSLWCKIIIAFRITGLITLRTFHNQIIGIFLFPFEQRTCCLLAIVGQRHRECEVVTQVQRYRFDQDVLISLQPVELPGGWAPQPAMPHPLLAGAMSPSVLFDLALPPSAMPTASREFHIGGGAAPRMPRRSRQVIAAHEIAPSETELADARAQAADEARRLEQPAGTELERRDTLDDLATRLDALVRHLDAQGIDPGPLRAIVEMLGDETLSSTQRWDRARQALTDFAQAVEAARRPFWKRS